MQKQSVWLIGALCLFVAACGRPAFGPQVRSVEFSELQKIAPPGKLSETARPTHYSLDLQVDPRKTQFSGKVSIDLELAAALPGIWMHGKDLDVSRISIRAGGETLPATWTPVLKSGVVWVSFPRRLQAEKATLTVDYSAKFGRNLLGLFNVTEQGKAYALAKSESIQARRFMPSFDQPAFKAPFDITLTVPEEMRAISNAPVKSEEQLSNGMKRVAFETTRPVATYLLSIAIGEFDRAEHAPIPPNAYRTEPIPLTGYARAGKGEELDFILSVTPELVRIYEEALELPYPYQKLDIIAAPQWPSGATELAGAITFRESRILANEGSGQAFIRGVLEIHSHELSHMWFGNLVTPPWWDDLWLKEGFASWASAMALSEFAPAGGHDIDAVADAISAMRLDSLAAARAVREPIERNEDVRNAYDAITYRKGMAIIGMIDNYFGPDVFRPAMGKYVETFADGVADSPQFFAVMSKTTGEPLLAKAFASFVEQSGLPLLSAQLQCNTPTGVKVQLSQSRYRPLGSRIKNDRSWVIPVCLSWQEDGKTQRACTMMDKERTLLALGTDTCPSYIMPNAGGAGYYRFVLDSDSRAKLAEALPDLPATEALVTIDSAMAGYESGALPPKDMLQTLRAGARHRQRQVVQAVMANYDKLINCLPEGSAAQKAARENASSMIAPVEARLLRQKSGPDDFELAGRINTFQALVLKDETERARLMDAVKSFTGFDGERDESAMSSDVYQAALIVAVQDGGVEMIGHLLSVRSEIDDPAFDISLASALGAARSPAASARVLGLIKDGTLGPRETLSMALGQMSMPETRGAVWQALRDDFPTFLEHIPGQRKRLTPRLAAGFCDTARIPELQALFAEYGDLAPGHERALAETIERIELCDALKTATQDNLAAAFMASAQ